MEPTELAQELAGFGALDQVNVWLARGDGVAVYENVALDHSELGCRQFVSFGGPDAQLEVDEPPTRLPDIGDKINWPYQLRGTYRGEPLTVTG